MFTYQVRPRIYRHATGQSLTFPNTFEAAFVLMPGQPFGTEAGGGKTATRAVAAHLLFNGNSGHHFVESNEPLRPLEVVIVEEGVRRVEFKGNRLTITGRAETLAELDKLVSTVFYVLPILLNVEMADPPVVERVEGKVGDVPFRWELDNWHAVVLTTTRDEQEKKVGDAWGRFSILSEFGNRRLAAALHYFHVYCRLCRAGQTPWEFMAEAIMNLSKILEALFPSSGDGKTIDAARAGLRKLGFTPEEIDRDYIPAMALRSKIDSAHVHLSLLTMPQLRVLHAYTEAAEGAFRKLLGKILTEVEGGRIQVTRHAGTEPDPATVKIIERLAQHFGRD
jgi:hypothetical protein